MANAVEEYCDDQSNKICDWCVMQKPYELAVHLYQFISLETFEQIVKRTNSHDLNAISKLLKNKNIPIECVLPYCTSVKTMYEFCISSRLTIECILNNPSAKWNWYEITKNVVMTIEIIEEHDDLPWIWNYVISKSHITEKFINKYLHKINNFCNVFRHSNISWKFIVQHADKFLECNLDSDSINAIVVRERTILAEFYMRAIFLTFIMDFYQDDVLPRGFTAIDEVLSNSYIISRIANY